MVGFWRKGWFRSRAGQSGVFYIISLLILTLGAGYLFLEVTNTDRNNREEMLRRTRLLASALNPAIIQSLHGDNSDLLLPEYRRLRDELYTVQQAFPELRSIMLLGRRSNGEIFTYLTSAPAKSPGYCLPGSSFVNPSAAFVNACRQWTELLEGPHKGGDGPRISALVPIIDQQNGEPICGLSIDINAASWNLNLLQSALPGALLCALLLVMVFFTQRQLQRRQQLGPARPAWLKHLESITTAATGVVLAAFIAWRVGEQEQQQRLNIFRQLADSYSNAVIRKLSYDNFTELEGMANFFACSDLVSKAEFDSFVLHLVKHSMVRLWGWVDIVKHDQRQDYEQRRRLEGMNTFAIVEPDENQHIVPAQPRDLYYPNFR